MHQPRPYGVFGADSDEDAAAIELLARRLTNIKQLSGVDSLRMVRTLPSGAFAVAKDMGGVFKIIIQKRAEVQSDLIFDGIANVFVPMIFSGVITNSILMGDEGTGIRLTEQTRRRIANYSVENLPAREVSLQRFRIDYGVAFSEFKPNVETIFFYTQYAQQRPTWYSGAMAEVMQIVGSYGRQDLGSLPNTTVERAKLLIPTPVLEKIQYQIGNVRLPGYTGLPASNGQFKYDYKFNNTHGVSFDTNGDPWLVRVATDGVWAMPLPTIPATTTLAFRQFMERVDDSEVLKILSRFGGMPSGESFPSSAEEFQAWRRAGVIIKVCDVGDFYSHIAYSSACGWSFNSSGTEGFNTCYDYDEDKGLGYGLAYKMRLRLGSAVNKGKIHTHPRIDDPTDESALNAYLSALYALIARNTAVNLAIKYKLRRSSPSAILANSSRGNVGQRDIDYWNNLVMEPIATHSGNVSEVGRGYLYNGAKFMYQPQIKFPEPLEGGCISHDFLPLSNGRHRSSYPNSDTIMFGYYVGDNLKVIKYFREERSYQNEVEDDYEDCMIVGSWTRTTTIGSTQLFGNFYTTDFDERKAMAPSVTVTKTVGKDLGYDSKPYFAYDSFFHRAGSITRNRYFSTKINNKTVNGQWMSVAVCIPYFCRNAVLHALKESSSGSILSEKTELDYIQDPWYYRYWTHDSIFHWVGGLNVMRGLPYPKNSSPVWVEMEVYEPSECSDFANRGPWITALPTDFQWLVNPPGALNGGGGPPSFNGSFTHQTIDGVSSGNLGINIHDGADVVHRNVPNSMYFLGSPDPYVDVFYRDASKVVFGDSIYANASENDGELRVRWGYTRLADHKSAHHFIGVINE